MKKRSGQVWVETVIYTLIAFVLIGTVLAFVKPKIDELQDKAIIEQSIGIMENINNLILSSIQGGEGNRRVIDIVIKKGSLTIDSQQNKLVFEIDSAYLYSEEGIEIKERGVDVLTRKVGSQNVVTLTNNYLGRYEIMIDSDNSQVKTLSKASTFHKISIANKGKDEDGLWVLDITLD